MAGIKVAVIGLGALGLVALKNLVEEGYDVVGFERNKYIGGLWQYTEERRTSVLKSTQVNISKERGCFTDFPFPEETTAYPAAGEVQRYLQAYARHFELESRFRLNTTVLSVVRDDAAAKWIVTVRDEDSKEEPERLLVDKVVVANGANNVPNIPVLDNQNVFQGRILHSWEYKVPEEFKGQRVLVVGLGNTAADTATSLAGVAGEIYLSHTTGAFVMPRFKPDGSAFDHAFTYRKMSIQYAIEQNVPSLADKIAYKVVSSAQNNAFNVRPEWKFSPAPPLIHHIPIISDNLVSCLESGAVASVPGPRRIVDASTVELDNGVHVDVDAIIFCTGYNTDYSILGEHDPTRHRVLAQRALLNTGQPGGARKPRKVPIPALYRNIFSLDFPESLAILGTAAFPAPAFQTYDLASMAIAQLWQPGPTKPTFPAKHEMYSAVEAHLDWAESVLARGPLNPRWLRAPEWMAWAESTAGVRLQEHLSPFSLAAWRFWYHERELSRLLMDGILSPHVYRLFDSEGRRKKWDGARAAIEKVNRDIKKAALLREEKNKKAI